MKVLVVKPILPWPPNQGTKRVTLSLLEALSPGNEVTLAAPSLSRSEQALATELEKQTGARVITALAPNRRSPFHRAWYKGRVLAESFLGGHSPRALYSSPGNLMREVGRRAGGVFDLAIFEYWYTYRWFPHVRARRRVLLAHDAEFSVNRLAASEAGAGGARGRSRWAESERRREIEACHQVDQVWTLTDADGDALALASRLPRSRFVTMPFGVDTGRLNVPAGGPANSVLFFGAFAADFNCDALDYLLADIWPAIALERPEAHLTVAGGGLPAPLAARVVAAGGTVLGETVDVRDLYRSAAVVVIPLRFGGGLRIRLLEALSCARAVVATPVAVAGMAGRDGEHYRVRATPRELAGAVVELLERPEEIARLGNAGRRLVEEVYSAPKAAVEIRRMALTSGERQV